MTNVGLLGSVLWDSWSLPTGPFPPASLGQPRAWGHELTHGKGLVAKVGSQM